MYILLIIPLGYGETYSSISSAVFIKRGLDLDPIWVPLKKKQEYFIDISSNIVENIQFENKITDHVSPKTGSHTVWKGIVSLHPSLI